MNMNFHENVNVKVESGTWVYPEPGFTLSDVVADLQHTNPQYPIEIIDEEGGRAWVRFTQLEHPIEEVWCCDYCNYYSRNREWATLHEDNCMNKQNKET